MKQYENESSDEAVQFVAHLSSMAVNGQDNCQHYTTEWIRKVNRGGLFCTNDCTNDCAYELFLAVKRKVRVRLPQHLLSQHRVIRVSSLKLYIVSNNDVQFNWSMLSADIDSEVYACELLEEMKKLLVSMQGFSTASA